MERHHLILQVQRQHHLQQVQAVIERTIIVIIVMMQITIQQEVQEDQHIAQEVQVLIIEVHKAHILSHQLQGQQLQHIIIVQLQQQRNLHPQVKKNKLK